MKFYIPVSKNDICEFVGNVYADLEVRTTTFFEIAEPQKKKRFLSKNSYFLHEIRLEKLQKYA